MFSKYFFAVCTVLAFSNPSLSSDGKDPYWDNSEWGQGGVSHLSLTKETLDAAKALFDDTPEGQECLRDIASITESLETETDPINRDCLESAFAVEQEKYTNLFSIFALQHAEQ